MAQLIKTNGGERSLFERTSRWKIRSIATIEILREVRTANYLNKNTLELARDTLQREQKLEADPELAKRYYAIKAEHKALMQDRD